MRRAVSLSGAAFALLCILLIFFMLPAGAQNDGGIPAGTPANGVDTSNQDDPPDVVVIAAEGCTVSRGASITLEDGDGTQATFTDGERGITITDQNGRPRIESEDGEFVADDSHVTFPTDDTSFDTDGDYTVVSSTGITGCRGGSTTNNDGTTPAQDQYSQGDEGCTNPQSVETFSGTENQQTAPFNITGESFRIRFETDPAGQDPFLPTVEVNVLNQNGQPIGEGFLAFEGEDGSENILAGPGTFSLEIRADEASYDITVEDCSGSPGAPGDVNNPKDVVPDTASGKKVPDTGGPPYIALGALVLLSVSVVVGGRILRP